MDFEAHREHLHGVAFRMLGSHGEADDAVQAWLRLHRSDVSGVANARGWLTTVVARICLDELRSRQHRREEPLDESESVPDRGSGPEDQAVLADSVGVALMVVLEQLGPAERLALVLHDVFGVPFTEIGPIIERSPNATAQLTVRARRRVRGAPIEPGTSRAEQRRVVEAFLAAARDGDFDRLVALLHPDVALRADAIAAGGAPVSLRGADEVAARARLFAANAAHAEPALIDGAVGLVVASDGALRLVLRFEVAGEVVVGVEIVADPARLQEFDFAVLA